MKAGLMFTIRTNLTIEAVEKIKNFKPLMNLRNIAGS
jgi:hypothetical protein